MYWKWMEGNSENSISGLKSDIKIGSLLSTVLIHISSCQVETYVTCSCLLLMSAAVCVLSEAEVRVPCLAYCTNDFPLLLFTKLYCGCVRPRSCLMYSLSYKASTSHLCIKICFLYGNILMMTGNPGGGGGTYGYFTLSNVGKIDLIYVFYGFLCLT